MMGKPKEELTTEIGEKEYVVAVTIRDGRRYAVAGSTETQAKRRLNDLITDVFGERVKAIAEEWNTEIIPADIASVHYVEECYNGEELTEENLVMSEGEMETIREKEVWPESWKQEMVNRLGHEGE